MAFKDVSMEQAVATIRAAVDAGVRFIDTALAYTRPGFDSFAETAVAAALRGRSDRDQIVVATKGGHRRVGDSFPVDASAHALRRDCAVSLSALRVDAIDLYQLHHVDPRVPIEESVLALRDLQDEGQIRTIGLSNVDLTQIGQAQSIATIASVQNRFSLDYPDDRRTVEYCARHAIAYLAYMPLGGTRGTQGRADVDDIARRLQVSPPQIRLAWIRAQGAHIMPLVGASRPETIQDSVAAINVRLNQHDRQILDQTAATALGHRDPD
jgi:aryl-alcohol dehydrogenase-like predicted oxidoreductase